MQDERLGTKHANVQADSGPAMEYRTREGKLYFMSYKVGYVAYATESL